MKLTTAGMCRSATKAYVNLVIQVDTVPSVVQVEAYTHEGASVPLSRCVVDGWVHKNNGFSCSCLFVMPLFQTASFQFVVRCTNESGEEQQASVSISSSELAWRSKLMYALRKRKAAGMRALGDNAADGVEIIPVRAVVDNEEVILHFDVVSNDKTHGNLDVELYRNTGERLHGSPIRLEAHRTQTGKDSLPSKQALTFSVRVPKDIDELYLAAVVRDDVLDIAADDSDFSPKDLSAAIVQSCTFVVSGGVDLRSMHILSAEDLIHLIQESVTQVGNFYLDVDFHAWYEAQQPSGEELERQRGVSFEYNPCFSIIVPLYATPIAFFDEMVQSVFNQTYSNWQLVLVNADPTNAELENAIAQLNDRRIAVIQLEENKGITGNTNEGIKQATGDFIAFLDHDDILSPETLYEYVRVVNDNRAIDVLYCDEDLLDQDGIHRAPNLKPDFNLDLLYSHNYISHFFAIKRSLMEKVGCSPEYVSGSQDYDLSLRAIEQCESVYHVAKVLYHWRIHDNSTSSNAEGKSFAHLAGKRALEDHFERRNMQVRVDDGPQLFSYAPKFLINGNPSVSVVIPAISNVEMLASCIRSVLAVPMQCDIHVVCPDKMPPESLLVANRVFSHDGIFLHQYHGGLYVPQMINYGTTQTQSNMICAMSPFSRILTPLVFEDVIGYALRPEVGIVGAKLLYPDGLTYGGGIAFDEQGSAVPLFHYLLDGDMGYYGRPNKPQNLSAVSGVFHMMRRDVFDALEGYSEDYRCTCADIDFCLRAQKRNFLVVFNPAMKLQYAAASRGVASGQAHENCEEQGVQLRQDEELLRSRWAQHFALGDSALNPNIQHRHECWHLRS